MAAIRKIEDIAAKWGRVTPQRAPEYLSGVTSPKSDWAKNADAAKETHKAAMVSAATRDAYSKGVIAAGTATWQKGAIQKGPGRFAEGVQIAQPDYQKGFQKYHSVISAVVLPPRFPKGDIRNLDRVKAISTAMRTAKIT